MKYFKKYIKIAPLSHAIMRHNEAEEISKIIILSPILDIGCGFGEFTNIVFNQMIDTGIDVSQEDLKLAAERKKYKKLLWADARNLPIENNSFNTALSVSTIEHIDNVQKVFSETFRVLKPGGVFIFTVPTSYLNNLLIIPSFFTKIRLAFISRLYLVIYHKVFKHKTIASKNEWIFMVKKAGFKINYCHNTLSKKQAMAFELNLPFALPYRLFHLVSKKRPSVMFPKIREIIFPYIYKSILQDKELTEANIIIVARKP